MIFCRFARAAALLGVLLALLADADTGCETIDSAALAMQRLYPDAINTTALAVRAGAAVAAMLLGVRPVMFAAVADTIGLDSFFLTGSPSQAYGAYGGVQNENTYFHTAILDMTLGTITLTFPVPHATQPFSASVYSPYMDVLATFSSADLNGSNTNTVELRTGGGSGAAVSIRLPNNTNAVAVVLAFVATNRGAANATAFDRVAATRTAVARAVPTMTRANPDAKSTISRDLASVASDAARLGLTSGRLCGANDPQGCVDEAMRTLRLAARAMRVLPPLAGTDADLFEEIRTRGLDMRPSMLFKEGSVGSWNDARALGIAVDFAQACIGAKRTELVPSDTITAPTWSGFANDGAAHVERCVVAESFYSSWVPSTFKRVVTTSVVDGAYITSGPWAMRAAYELTLTADMATTWWWWVGVYNSDTNKLVAELSPQSGTDLVHAANGSVSITLATAAPPGLSDTNWMRLLNKTSSYFVVATFYGDASSTVDSWGAPSRNLLNVAPSDAPVSPLGGTFVGSVSGIAPIDPYYSQFCGYNIYASCPMSVCLKPSDPGVGNELIFNVTSASHYSQTGTQGCVAGLVTSTDYSTVDKAVAKKSMRTFIDFNCYVRTITVKDTADDGPLLTSNFKNDALLLGKFPDNDQYLIDFINRYGTHFVKAFNVGGAYSYLASYASSDTVKEGNSAWNMNAEIGLSLSAAFGASASTGGASSSVVKVGSTSVEIKLLAYPPSNDMSLTDGKPNKEWIAGVTSLSTVAITGYNSLTSLDNLLDVNRYERLWIGHPSATVQAARARIVYAYDNCEKLGLCSKTDVTCPEGMYASKASGSPSPGCQSCFSNGPTCNVKSTTSCTSTSCVCKTDWGGAKCEEDQNPIARCRQRLGPDEVISAGEYLCSANKRYFLIVQFDGNLVLRKDRPGDGTPYWSTHTDDGDSRRSVLRMNTDGNLVLYLLNGEGQPWTAVWSTETFGSPYYAMIDPQGSLLVIDSTDRIIDKRPFRGAN
ncbi:hypothetical protein FOA52_005683 [Chlamydomonas sp. UWO 241]|nr:hypothetical protein FOA52_005683 [Chlamydomonas sp. UWO 241]